MVKGIKYTLQKYQTAHDREIIDDMLMNFTGYTLEVSQGSKLILARERTRKNWRPPY